MRTLNPPRSATSATPMAPSPAPVTAARGRLGRTLGNRLGNRLLHSPVLEALAYPHGVDRYVELLRPLLVRDEVRAEVTGVRHQTARSVTLTLSPNENWKGIRAGQFVGLRVAIDGVWETRPYSPAGSEHAPDGSLELTISTHPEGKVSRFLRDRAHPGMILGLTRPEGAFTLPDPRPERVLLISGGSGITPVMAMLRTLCAEAFAGEIGFLNYARSPELALYGPELEALAATNPRLRVLRCFTRGGDGQLTGRLTREHLQGTISDHRHAATFVCGPPALISAASELWAADGLEAPSVESFTAPALPRPAGEHAEGIVSFVASARRAANSGLALLEQAEDVGLFPDHGCRMGICNTCAARKLEGTVQNVLSGAISGPGEEQIRICVSVPLGDVALDL